MLKYSCPDFAFPLLRYDQVCSLIRLLGFDAVDVGLMEGRTHHQPSEALRSISHEALALRGELTLRGLRAADLFYQAGGDFSAVAINHPDSALRTHLLEEFRRVVEFASVLGTKHITILPGARFDEGSFDLAAAQLAERVRIVRDAGLTLGVEAHLGSVVPTPESAKALCDAVPGLTLTLDLSHFERQGVEHDRVWQLVPYASHVHARGANRLELQCPVKDNTIDFATLADKLVEAGFDGWCDLEYTYSPWENSNRTDNLSEILQMRTLLEATGK